MDLERVVFAFFPYLVTRDRVTIRGIEFRSNQDIDDLSHDVQDHLRRLSEMFFVQDGLRIEQMTCAQVELPADEDAAGEVRRRLNEAHLLVGYLYSQPRPSGGVLLPFESSTLFVFRIGDGSLPGGKVITRLVWPGPGNGSRFKQVGMKEIPTADLVEGYSGIRNQTTRLWVAEGTRIYPEQPHLMVNMYQNLGENLAEYLSHQENWAFRYLVDSPTDYPHDLRGRVFVSLDWYMKSCRDSVVEAEALVHLAIALESLLRVRVRPGERLTERFKDAILTLLGPVPRLDGWIEQFYDARSKAVHEGVPSTLDYFPLDKEELKRKQKRGESLIPHRSLLEYGRRIFRLCLSSVVTGSTRAVMSGLEAYFVPDQERIEQICKELNAEGSNATGKLLRVRPIVYQLVDCFAELVDPRVVKLKSVVGVVKTALRVYRDTGLGNDEPAKGTIDKLIASSSEPIFALLTDVEECAKQLRSGETDATTGENRELTDTVLALLDYAAQPGFKIKAMYARDAER